jgi:quinol monooxygenase YgiN
MAYMINATVDFKSAKDRDRFVPLQQAHQRRSLENEDGTLRFDFSLSVEDEKQLLLQELYESREAFEAHWTGDSMKIILGECEAMGIEAEIKGWHGATVD